MRKYQVQADFEQFCGDLLIIAKTPTIYGGVKSPLVHFEVCGVKLTYLADKNRVIKPQARDTLVFLDAMSVLTYAKTVDANGRANPNSRSGSDVP